MGIGMVKGVGPQILQRAPTFCLGGPLGLQATYARGSRYPIFKAFGPKYH